MFSFLSDICEMAIRGFTWQYYWGTQRQFSVLNICSEKQKLPRMFYTLRNAKNFWMMSIGKFLNF